MLYKKNNIIPEVNTKYNFINVITGDEKHLINIYPDDTNLMIMNKLSLKIETNILTDEICAFVNNYDIIGFNYEKDIDISKIFNKKLKTINKSSLKDFLDLNFVDQLDNKRSIFKNNKLHELFENNFPINENIIYYFTLKELLELNNDINNKFLYSVIYKYFPNIIKNYIENYESKENIDKRKSYYDNINELINYNDGLMNILNNNTNYLKDDIDKKDVDDVTENIYINKLLKYNFNNEENRINIINLFSDFELNNKYVFIKLILEDYENTFYKIYKPELKLKLSDNTCIIDKDICNKLISDYKDNINTPLNVGYIPSFIQPKNCLIIKSYLKNIKLFYSFILYIDGDIDITINNYYNINIDDDIINKVIKESKILINKINTFRIYSINKIPNNISNNSNNIHFINSEILFSMDNFVNKKQQNIYSAENIINYLSNFNTHIRIMKEKMDFNLDKDDIIVHYKKVNNYENVDVIQSIITTLNNPENDLTSDQLIELISKNTSLSIEQAGKEYQKWLDNNSSNMGNKKYSLQTKETGSEIIINKYLNKYIKFQIYNVHSYDELNRIVKFIKIFMYLYSLFISDKLNKSLKPLFTKISKLKLKNINKLSIIQQEQEQKQFIDKSIIIEEHNTTTSSSDDIPFDSGIITIDDDDDSTPTTIPFTDDPALDKPVDEPENEPVVMGEGNDGAELADIASKKEREVLKTSSDSSLKLDKESKKDSEVFKTSSDSSLKLDKPADVADDDDDDDNLDFNKIGNDDDDTTTTTTSNNTSGGGSKSNKDVQMFKIDNKQQYLNNLKEYDKKLFLPKPGFSFSAKCTNNQGIRMPVPLYDSELEKVDKNDILKTVKIKEGDKIRKLKQKEYNDFMKKFSKNELIEELKKNSNIEFSLDFPSYYYPKKQANIDDPSININYICPKYWDLSKNVGIHPRDIYDQLDKIIPQKFKGETDKYIFSKEGSMFSEVSDKKIEKIILKYIKNQNYFELYIKFFDKKVEEELKKTLIDSIKIKSNDKQFLKDMNFEINKLSQKFKGNDRKLEDIKKLKIKKNEIFNSIDEKYNNISLNNPKFNEYISEDIYLEAYNLIHQDIVKNIQPRFFDDYDIDGYKVPCCFSYKPGYEKDTNPIKEHKLDKYNIRLAELTPCNINKFAHVHPKLQKLFNHNNDFYINQRHYGGFIKYGVKQDYNALLYTLSNLHYKNNDNKSYELFKKDYFNISLYNFMKIGDGNILQLFKSEHYNINDIAYFFDLIYKKNILQQFEKTNISKSQLNNIKKYLLNFKNKLSKEINSVDKKNYNSHFKELKYEYINEFNNLINNSNKNYNIKFIYDLIISHNNYIKYLNSNEIKDYKFIIPLASVINPNNVYIIFENIDDNINIKLPFNTYDINDKSIFKFIYKINNIYEPIYYLNNINEIIVNGKEDNMTCDLFNNLHNDNDINIYINNILKGITDNINEIYRNKYLDINLFELDELLKILKIDNENIKLLVDNYCKISHVIINNKYIYPIIPCGIIDGYKLIYDFNNNIPTYNEFLEYSKINIIRNKFIVKGIIVNDKNEIINILFVNNSYIPIKPIKYDKKNRHMKKYKILGNKDIFLINKDLQNFLPGNDIRVDYNNDINYIKYITNLTIQNIIFYIKKNYNLNKFYTNNSKLYNENEEYIFKRILLPEKDKYFIEKNNDLIDYNYESNKFKGIIKNIGNKIIGNDFTELSINISYLDEMYLILNDKIKINFDKQNELYEYINKFIKNIVIELPDEEYDKYKLNKDISICFNNDSKNCKYPCINDLDKCKLYVKKSSIYDNDNKSLINKIIWKFIDLLLIHKNIDNINRILQDNINISDLYKTAKTKEIFFNYSQYINKYLDDLFNYESEYIRNINFYDQINNNPISSNKPKPVTSILKGTPNIIKQLFKSGSNILTYIDKNNLDFISLTEVFKELKIENADIDYKKFKSDICEELDKFSIAGDKRKNMRFIVKSYELYDKDFNLTDLEKIKENINQNNYKISPYDLELLSKIHNVGFLLITSKYSNQSPSKLKHNIIFKYNPETFNKDNTNIILLYHYLNEDNKYDLSNIIIKVNDDDYEDESSYKTYILYNKLSDKIKTIIENDYPEINI